MGFVEKLYRAVYRNAELGVHTQQLFAADQDEDIRASALLLGTHDSIYTAEVLRQRLDLEKERIDPDPELVELLSRLIERITPRMAHV